MGKVIASITTSVDGYVTGPDDGPGAGLGVGGERLHYWVMGGPWTYAGEHDTNGATGADKEFIDGLVEQIGAGVCGRGMYEAAGAWGGTNPFGGRLFVVTHRTEDAPDAATGFTFVDVLRRGSCDSRPAHQADRRRRAGPSARSAVAVGVGDLHEQAALPAHRHRQVPVDQERQAAEHALLLDGARSA